MRHVLLWLCLLFSGPAALSARPGDSALPAIPPDSAATVSESSTADDVALGRLLAEGGRALDAGHLDDAHTAFSAASRLGDSPLAWLGLAEVAERRGEWLEGLGHARRALELEPGSAPALKILARLQIRLGAPAEALDSLDQLRRLAPDDPFGYLTAALVLRDVDRPQEALELLEQAAGHGLDDPPLVSQRGLLLLAAGRSEGALEVARGALATHPDSGELELVIGLALASGTDSRPEAIPWLRRALRHGAPDPGRIHLALGDLLADPAGACQEESLENFRRAVEARPQDPQAHYKLALALRACGDAEGARASIERFRSLSQDFDRTDHARKSTGAALNEVQELASAGRLEEALAELDSVLTDHPDEDRAWTLQAKLLFSMHRREEALTSAAQARRLRPSRVEAHYLEGLILSQLGRLAESEAALARAHAIDGDRIEVLQLLGAVVAERGRPDEAAAHFEHILGLGGASAVVHLAYAKVLETLGRRDESAEQLERYRALVGKE